MPVFVSGTVNILPLRSFTNKNMHILISWFFLCANYMIHTTCDVCTTFSSLLPALSEKLITVTWISPFLNIYLINNLFPVFYFPIKAQVYSSSGRITIRFTMYLFAGPLDPSLFLSIQVIKCKIDHSVWRCIRNCNQTPTILPNLHLGLTCHLASSLSACAHEALVAPSSACRHHTPHLQRKRTFNL